MSAGRDGFCELRDCDDRALDDKRPRLSISMTLGAEFPCFPVWRGNLSPLFELRIAANGARADKRPGT